MYKREKEREESTVETTGKRLADWQFQLYARNALRQAPGRLQKKPCFSHIFEFLVTFCRQLCIEAWQAGWQEPGLQARR
jgi:hypothetical protein